MIFQFFHPTITTLDISMALGHGGGNYRTNFSIQYGAGGELYSTAFGALLAFDTWYHYVLVITKAGNIKVYFNGVNLNLVTGTTDGTIRTYGGSVYPLPTASFPNTPKLRIFSHIASGGFSGNIDEFYVFNKELTQDDITLLYNKTYTLPINQYTLSVSEGTSISINSGAFQYLSGNYTISVGATQSSVVINGISQAGQTNPYPLQNGSTIAIRYSMLRRTISVDYYKKSGFIKYVPSLVGGEFPDTGSWAIVNIDSQALSEFAGGISFDRVIGNLPLDKLQNLDMSKITTGNLPFSRIDGNLAASRLDLSSGITLPADITAITSGGNGRVYYINNGASIYSGYGTGDIIQFRNADNTTLLSVNSDTSVRSAAFIAQGLIARGGGYDIRTFSGSTGMYIEMGNENTFIPHYFRLGSYGGVSFIESGYSKNIVFRVYSSYIPTGTYKQWAFNEGGASYNGFNSSTWTVPSDHRIKENIVKADLKTCYDNVKNINLYRYNFIDAFETGSNDKNKLGYIAQEVEKYFPKATYRQKKRLNDKREVPDLLSIDVEQINLSLYGAVKQLIKIVEKQNKRIKTLETLLNIEVFDEVEDDAGQAYEKIIDDEEINIDDIEPTDELPQQPLTEPLNETTEPSTEV